ncbi:hypothetical protein B0I37DRAFT_374840 [Chaetomium sp. MPI-CAGE-AT-0009]|nr:hypothetical protein B0I37DRAFT_374840 [Chaetomium sp. MPI-CAGE-AT-0009]
MVKGRALGFLAFALLLLGLASLRQGVSSMRGNRGGKASAGRGVGLLASCILGLDGRAWVWSGPRPSSHHGFACFKGSFVLFFNSGWGWFHADRGASHRFGPAGKKDHEIVGTGPKQHFLFLQSRLSVGVMGAEGVVE